MKLRLKRIGIDTHRENILDDHSRFVTASELFDEGITENIIWLLDRAVHEYAKPREILTDHGSQF